MTRLQRLRKYKNARWRWYSVRDWIMRWRIRRMTIEIDPEIDIYIDAALYDKWKKQQDTKKAP